MFILSLGIALGNLYRQSYVTFHVLVFLGW